MKATFNLGADICPAPYLNRSAMVAMKTKTAANNKTGKSIE
jgi:hypothetical protein